MRVLTGLALLIGLAGCNPQGGRETGRAADTSVMTRQTQDTAIVTSDTTVDTDTTLKKGDVNRDTVKR
jgi:hypothetical protein